MKCYLLVAFTLIVSVCSQTFEEGFPPTVKDFTEWMKLHGKRYTNIEFKRKFKAFLDNHYRVQRMNRIYEGKTEFILNAFADMTQDEFESKVLMKQYGKPFITPADKYLPSLSGLTDLPDTFDWREKGAVTEVKNQGSVGTCWAFSATQNIEGQYKLKGNPLTDLSTEQIVDCDGTIEEGSERADCGVYGGWPFLAFQYVQRAGGMLSEADYSYCSGLDKACFPCEAPGYNKTSCGPPIPYCFLKDSCQAKFDPAKFVPNLKVVDWKRTSENETDIAEQLMNVGPLSVALNAELLQFYHKGVFDPFTCNPKKLNHAVLIVGWGVEDSKIHGKRPYWIVKNSWGSKWGESGYFRILRNKALCGINTQVTTAILA